MNKFEQLALWYLRLNGYLTAPNFIIHPERRGGQRGEEDILGVRFPYSQERLSGEVMERDDALIRGEKTDFIIAQIKKRTAELSRTWSQLRKTEERCYVLEWLGMVPKEQVPSVADALYENGTYETNNWRIRLVCIGKPGSEHLPLQITWEQIFTFLSNRFKQFDRRKRDIEQWPEFLKEFYTKMTSGNGMNYEQFLEWLNLGITNTSNRS